MTKLNMPAFKKLVNFSRSKMTCFSVASKEHMKTAVHAWIKLLDDHDVDEPLLDFHAVGDKVEGFSSDDLSLDKEEKAESNSTAVANWMISLVHKLWQRVSEHSQLIKFNFSQAEAKEAEVARLKQEVEKLSKYCDDIQQRSMKGNLIISSPNLAQKKTLLKFETHKVNGDDVTEDATDLCCRLIKLKTGVTVPKEDISACHMLKRQGDESSYIIRFHNLKPKSAWEDLTAGLMTGKAYGQAFTDANVFINYQVTRARGELLKQAREARKSKRIHKYSTDQNGNISVQLEQRGTWSRISSLPELEQCISRGKQQRQQQPDDRWHRR